MIHQTWKTDYVPEMLKPCQQTWRSLNSGIKYMLWTDADMDAFMYEKSGEFYPRWKSYIHPIQRVDSFRYYLMYHVGGVYADLDMQCLKTIQPLLTHSRQKNRVILGEENQRHEDGTMRTGNAIMITGEPGHPFWGHVLRALETEYEKTTDNPSSVFLTTGPAFLHNVYRLYPEGVDVQPSSTFYPQMWHKPSGSIILATTRQYPQSYTVHHWAGTWRTYSPYYKVSIQSATTQSSVLTQVPRKSLGVIEQSHKAGNAFKPYMLTKLREITDLVQPEHAIVVGGYTGHVALFILSWLPKKSTLSIYEPHEAYRSTLVENIEYNRTTSMCAYSIHETFPWSYLTPLYCYHKIEPTKPHRVAWSNTNPNNGRTQPVFRTQSSKIDASQINPGVLVIETCTNEIEVLKSAENTIRTHRPVIFIQILSDELRKVYMGVHGVTGVAGPTGNMENDVVDYITRLKYAVEKVDVYYYMCLPMV